jgi:hypothetical protein
MRLKRVLISIYKASAHNIVYKTFGSQWDIERFGSYQRHL